MFPEGRLFGSGTMRSGGTLTCNILSVHSKIIVFSELVHFFRHVSGRYDPLTPENIERMLHHQRIRLKYRFDIDLDVTAIQREIANREPSYRACYDEMMKYLLRQTGRTIWGDYATLHWRDIPHFLNMFPNSKAFHVYRDPRGLVSSFGRMSFMPDNLYLSCIFNWIDSINHIKLYQKILPPDRYLPVRFETIHQNPERFTHELCDFVGVPFESALIEPDRWPDLFIAPYVEANVSSYTKKRTYGFDPARSDSWRKNLKEWEIALVEFLARDQMQEMGYEFVAPKLDAAALRHGMDLLTRQPTLLKNLNLLLATGQGTSDRPNDPADPRNWGSPGAGFDKFVDSPAYAGFTREMDEVERRLGSVERRN
jgi:hypothetical protein